MTDTPKLAPATIERTDDGIRVAVLFEPHPSLDRLDAYAWGLRPRDGQLAQRLKRAVDEGAALKIGDYFTDVDGNRGIHVHATFLGRIMNAELRRMGY